MAIDPVRLARIRMRLVAAAATLVVPACGGNGQPNINEPAIDPPHKQHDGPINERVEDPPPVSPKPEPTAEPAAPKEEIHINTPPPLPTSDKPKDNRPNPNTAPSAAPTDKHINTPPPGPMPAPRPDHINTPKPN